MISKSYILSFDHTLNVTQVKHSGESLRFCAKKLDSSLKRMISFNKGRYVFSWGGGLGNFGIFSKRKCWPSLTF